MAFKFENLKVWQKALDLADNIDKLTKDFPKEEVYILTSQIKRAADSIVLNIAEGSTGQSNVEFIRFLKYALRSDRSSWLFVFSKKKKVFSRRKIFIII